MTVLEDEAEATEEVEVEPIPGPVLLDTNVLVYATNTDSPFYAHARELLDQAISGELQASLTPQILAEYYAVITDARRVARPLTPKQARRQIETLLQVLPLVSLQEGTSQRMVELAERYEIRAQEIYDAQVVAAMLDHGIPMILTANDQDFQRFREITVRNPFA